MGNLKNASHFLNYPRHQAQGPGDVRKFIYCHLKDASRLSDDFRHPPFGVGEGAVLYAFNSIAHGSG